MTATYRLLRTSDGGGPDGGWSAGDPYPGEFSEEHARGMVAAGCAKLAPGQTLALLAPERVEVAALDSGEIPSAELATPKKRERGSP